MGKFKEMDLLRQEQEREAPVQEIQRYSPDGEGGMEADSLGAYVKLQDVITTPAAQPAPWVGLTDEQMRAKFEADYCRLYPISCGVSPSKFERAYGYYVEIIVQVAWNLWKTAHGISAASEKGGERG